MKFLFFLAYLFAIIHVFYAVHSTHPFYKKYLELVASERPSTRAEESALGCFAWYCHFDDKKGCKNECKKWSELKLEVSFEDALKEYVGGDLKLCTADCISKMQKGPESEKVCANLCTMETSHPNRGKWEQWWKEMVAEVIENRRQGK